jgi:hypothetical protein
MIQSHKYHEQVPCYKFQIIFAYLNCNWNEWNVAILADPNSSDGGAI